MRRICGTLLLCIGLLLCCTVQALAADEAVLTITPSVTEAEAGDSETRIDYTITVTPPEGRAIGVFSFRLKPSGGMTLPEKFKVDGRQVIQYAKNGLRYDITTEKGVFKTFEYTPASCFFAAVGSLEDNRMTEAAEIMTITAAIPKGTGGVFALDAEFIAAPDGSGQMYPVRVETTPVTVTVPGGAAVCSSVAVEGLTEPTAGAPPDTDVTVLTGIDGAVCRAACTWYCDGAAMMSAAFETGHVYTAVLRLTLEGAVFGDTVTANAGYAVTRLSDTELELRRSFLVEAQYARELTEDEAQERIDFGDTAGDWQTPAPSGADGDAVQDPEELPDGGTADPQETPAETERGSAAAVIILAAAAALGVVLAVRRRRDRTR